MPRVLGVVGSPRKERGLTDRLVGEALAGAEAAGCATQRVYLADLDLQPCEACGGACFQTNVCSRDLSATQLSALVDRFDALILGAPVYTWRQNSLTSIFQDKLRLATGSAITGSLPAKPALGICVAGGTGSGIFGATQSVYRWFAVWAYRPLPPVLATRYNVDRAMEASRTSGQHLAEAIAASRPYADLSECLAYFDALPYLRGGYADEFFWLARQIDAGLAEAAEDEKVVALRTGLRAAEEALSQGDRATATRLIAPAYLAGREAWLAIKG